MGMGMGHRSSSGLIAHHCTLRRGRVGQDGAGGRGAGFEGRDEGGQHLLPGCVVVDGVGQYRVAGGNRFGPEGANAGTSVSIYQVRTRTVESPG